LESKGFDLSQFKKEESVNELEIIINKIFTFWEENLKLNTLKLDNDLLMQIISDLLLTMKTQGFSDTIQDILSPKFNRVRIDREDEIYFAAITTNMINEFIVNFGTNNFDESTISRLHNLLSEKEQSLFNKLTSPNINPTNQELNDIFNANLLEGNKSFENYIENFEEWKLRMKLALLNNCGYIDNEQNNKQVKNLLYSLESVDLNIE